MKRSFNVVFVSNYINHHQIPFCSAMHRLLEGRFLFVQTEAMEEERVRMGWHEEERPSYVRCFYEEEEFCRREIFDCDLLLFGGTDEECYISERLAAGRPIVRYSERLYKTGQWKAVSPRGLRKKYRDHTRYRRAAVYLLCAGAYVASDFHIVRAYPGKMYCWGYFPETRYYSLHKLMEEKGYAGQRSQCSGREQKEDNNTTYKNFEDDRRLDGGEEKVPYLLWAARMIGWKHPELAVETARHLKERGLPFHMDIIGDGDLRPMMEELAQDYGLGGAVRFCGYQPPETVRQYMERADIFLFTSDRQEGWGAVANEAMNSGCAVVAGHMIGAVPFLVRNGENGFVYEDGRPEQLFGLTETLVRDRELCKRMGRSAYETITNAWNAESAAERLTELMGRILQAAGAGADQPPQRTQDGLPRGEQTACFDSETHRGFRQTMLPCAPAPLLRERRARRQVRRDWKARKTK